MAWAKSPTTVIAPPRERRVAIRNCIGVRSCTSSMMMCPYKRTSSVSSMRPFLRGRGPITASTSSSSAASLSAHCTSAYVSLRARNNDAHSSSVSSSLPAERTNAFEPNKSCNNSAGVSTGHMRLSAARNSVISRSESRSASMFGSSSRPVAASAVTISVSTHRCAALCRRYLRRASRMIRADSFWRSRRKPAPNGMTKSSRSGRSRSRTACDTKSTIRTSPLTRFANSVSAKPNRCPCTRSASTTCSTPASPNEGSTCSI